MSEECGSCKFFHSEKLAEQLLIVDGFGYCRRSPPSQHTNMSTEGPLGTHGVYFPRVTSNGWCGEYKRNIDLKDEGVGTYIKEGGHWRIREPGEDEETGLEPCRAANEGEIAMSEDTRECSRCSGCGEIANDDDGTPWKYWAELPPGSDLAVKAGIVSPIECPECHGTGKTKER